MSTLGDIRAGIVANFAGTVSYDAFTGYLLTPPEPPCFEIDFPSDSYLYDQAFARGMDTFDLIVRGIVSLGEPDDAQVMLDAWLEPTGAGSVKSAIESDRTLGGACADLQVTRVSGHRRLATPEGFSYLAAEWTVRILLDPNA